MSYFPGHDANQTMINERVVQHVQNLARVVNSLATMQTKQSDMYKALSTRLDKFEIQLNDQTMIQNVSALAKELEALKPQQQTANRDVKQLQNQPTLEGGQAQPENQTVLGQGAKFDSEEMKDVGEILNQEMVDRLAVSSGRNFEESLWDASVLLGFKCVGLPQRILILIALFITIAVEQMFVLVVLANYSQQPINDEMLQGLLHWRAVVAHDFNWIDPATSTTLASRVCNHVSSSFRSGNQIKQYDDFQMFRKPPINVLEHLNGFVLCNMALCLWVFNIMYDISNNCWFMVSLLGYPRGVPCIRRVSEQSGAIVSLSWEHVVFMVLFVALPRLAISIQLGFSGILFLAYTSNVGDLLLNAMALVFVLEIDEYVFLVFLPHQVKYVLGFLEPLLPSRHFSATKSQGSCRALLFQTCGVLFRTITTVIVILLCNVLILIPFRDNMDLAMKYLCSGDLDVMYYEHTSGNSLVYVARSEKFDAATQYKMSYQKRAVLDAINMNIEFYQQYLTNPDIPANTLDYQSSAIQTDLTTLMNMVVGIDAGGGQFCIDHLNKTQMDETYSPDFAAKFRRAVRLGGGALYDIPLLDNCSQFEFWEHCVYPKVASPRALCPRHCGCDNPWMGNAYTGYGTGCSPRCNIRWNLNAYYLAPGNIAQYTDRCMDVSVEILTEEPSWIAYVYSLKLVFDDWVGEAASTDAQVGLLTQGCDYVNFLNAGLGICETTNTFITPRLWCPSTCQCTKSDMGQCPRSCSQIVHFQKMSHRQQCPHGLQIENVRQCELAASVLLRERMEVVFIGNSEYLSYFSAGCFLSSGGLIWSDGSGANISATFCRQPEPLLFDELAEGDFEIGKGYAESWLDGNLE